MTETAAGAKTAPNRLVALWNSVIGKKVVMAVTGGVLILFRDRAHGGEFENLLGP